MIVLLSLSGVVGALSARADAQVDLGDAPASFDSDISGPASAVLTGPRLGALATPDHIDPDTGVSVYASAGADLDGGDDGVTGLGPYDAGRLGSFGTDVTVSGVDAQARLCGWIDFDLSGAFDDVERTCTDLQPGDVTASLEWTGRPAAEGLSYARLRVGLVAAQVETPTGASDSGEVEDYPVSFAEVVRPKPGLDLVESVAPTRVSRVGEELAYTFTATNSGEVELSDVRISNELPGLSPLDCEPIQPTTLAVGTSLVCTATRAVTQDDLDFGAIVDISEAVAEAPGGDPADDSDDVAALADGSVDALQRPRLAMTAAADRTSARSGATVALTYVVTNDGNVTLTDPSVASSLRGLGLSCGDAPAASLAPDASVTCTGRYDVTTSDARRGRVNAKATARAERPYGDPAATSDDVVASAAVSISVSGGSVPSSPTRGGTAGGAVDGLPATGGPPLLLGLAGLSAAALGALLLASATRRRAGR